MTPLRRNFEHAEQVWLLELARPLLVPLLHLLELSLLLVLASSCLYAQAAAEYGGATSGMAASISRTNLMKNVTVPDMSANGDKSVIMSQPMKTAGANPKYIFDSMKQGSVAENRKALEVQAGKNAAKLMLRSTPTHADVKIDGKPVGKTPILLVLSPGQYDVAMNGPRMDHAEQNIDLLPNETREFLLPLKQLYPTTVKIQLH
ncbi:MAG TPA: PEGA domain-containing protein [Terriglobia bacterium]|nr:PEGA domain-containing protein [Terriglobia bacterium]